jgi:hypothetical protein
MDMEDRNHFKTIAGALPERYVSSGNKSTKASSHSPLAPHSCLKKAEMIAGCYRRDEAQNPEMFAAALAIILGDYPAEVVDYVADPRTGVITEFPMGLPNVGQIQSFCDRTVKRFETMAKPRAIAVPYVPPPLKPGQINAIMFNKLVAEGKTYARPVGRFEKVDDEWNRDLTLDVAEKVKMQGFVEANQKWLNREHASAGTNASFETISPALKKLLAEQDKKREADSGLS